MSRTPSAHRLRSPCPSRDANLQLKEWLLQDAGNRVHGTLHDVPLRLFAELEKSVLKPLPDRPVEMAEWAQVKLHPDCHVVFQKSSYSPPEGFVGNTLWLRAGCHWPPVKGHSRPPIRASC